MLRLKATPTGLGKGTESCETGAKGPLTSSALPSATGLP